MRHPAIRIEQAILRPHSAPASYALALASVLLALVGRLALWPLFQLEAPFLFFIGAVVVTAWYGGFGPGLFAAFWGAVVADYFLVPPLHTIGPRSWSQAIWLVSFCLIGALISWLMQNLKSLSRKVAEAAAEVRRSEAELRTILDTLPLGVWLTDRSGKVTFANPEACRLWGVGESAEIGGSGVTPWSAASGERIEARDEPVEQALRGEPRLNSTARVEIHGAPKVLLNSAVPLKTPDGGIAGAVVVNEDITERHRTAELLERQRRLLDTIFDNILASVAYLDRDFNFVRVNAAYAQSSGYTAAEMIGRNHFELFPDPENQAIFEQVRDTGQSYVARAREFEYANQPERGKTYWDWWLCTIPGTKGEVAGLVLSLAEVTDTELARRSVEKLNLELREADRHKDEFLAMLSHELRNPLGAILSAVLVLKQRGPDDPVSRSALDAAERQVRHVARLLDDLLDVSRVTLGKIRLNRERVDLAAVLERSLQANGPQIQKRKQEVFVSIAPEPLVVDGDPSRLEQLFSNLLNNAAKYSDPCGRISVTAARQGDTAVVRVRDTGAGIPPELQPHVFDLFVQGERPIDRSQGGLGIGLTMVRRIAELHGGNVEVYSQGPGSGSEFTVRIPVCTAAAEAPGARSQSAAEGCRRILVIEDNADCAEMLRLLLEMEGHTVCVALDGRAGFSVAAECRPDVVLIDIGLPGMDGYEVCSRLRQEKSLGNMRLIALSGYGREEDIRKSRQAGFDAHITKPAEIETLRQALGPPGRAVSASWRPS